jgi:tol-pal system protein YbgF
MARVYLRAAAASALMLVLAAGVHGPGSTASAQDGERSFNFFDRIFSGSERLSGSGGERAVPTAADPDRTGATGPAGSDLFLRVDRLEAQVRQLTGIIEQLQFRNQQLEGQLRRMQEGGLAGAVQARPQQGLSAATGGMAASAPPRRGDAFDPALHPGAPGAPHSLGAMGTGSPPPVGAQPVEGIGAPGGRAARDPLDLATISPPGSPQPSHSPAPGGAIVATLPPSAAPRDEFDLAYGYLLRRDYALAEESFRAFLSRHPNDRLAGEATFWFGETLFQRQRFRDAAEAFLNVSTKFELSPKAPDALLRLGQSLAALGEKEAACASLGEVLRKFPRASAPVKQGVEREQKRVRC